MGYGTDEDGKRALNLLSLLLANKPEILDDYDDRSAENGYALVFDAGAVAQHMRQRAVRVAVAVDPQPGERWHIPGRGPADVIARDDYQVQFKDAATGRPVFTTLQWLRSWRPLLKPLSLQADAVARESGDNGRE